MAEYIAAHEVAGVKLDTECQELRYDDGIVLLLKKVQGTWLITEAEREGDDWRLFGYCHIHEWEWGYLMLSELAYLRLPFGLTIERDIYTARKYVRDFLPQDE